MHVNNRMFAYIWSNLWLDFAHHW